MKKTCTLLSASAIAAHISLMKTQWDIGSRNFKKIQKFLADVKNCSIPGETFMLLIQEYQICLILAENPALTPQQIITLINCDVVKNKENTGNEQMFKKLLANNGNNENSRKHLIEKQELVLQGNYLTSES